MNEKGFNTTQKQCPRAIRLRITPSKPSFTLRTLLLAFALWGAARSGLAEVTFQLFDVSSPPMSAAQTQAFQEAADLWKGQIKDNITIKLNVGFKNLENNILGQTLPMMVTHNYSTVLAALSGSQIPQNVISALPASSLAVTDINGDDVAQKLTLTRANARALGIGTGIDPQWGDPLPNDADAQVVFANGYAAQFDIDRSDGIAPNKYDFITIAAHEIGHVLGFVSLTDVQDHFPNYNLNPSTLDIWRFADTGGTHQLGSEPRLITAGPAEYYTTTLNNIPFSWGVLANDPNCGSGNGCQASHWRDNVHNQLMDPTLGFGESKNVGNHDAHAMHYIGYDNKDLLFKPNRRYWPIRKCIFDWLCPGCPPDFDFGYPRWDDDPFVPDMDPNAGFVMNMEVQADERGEPVRRTLVGTVLFADARPNRDDRPVPELPPVEGAVQIFPPRPPVKMLPPALLDMYLVSDRINGVRFTARAAFSSSGAQFERSLGPNGGYHVTLAVDGDGDGVRGDVDGWMTLEILAGDDGSPEPGEGNKFHIDPEHGDNDFTVTDPAAFGDCALVAQTEEEPNNTPDFSTDLGLEAYTQVIGSIEQGDWDYYRFYAPSNSRAWITVDTGGAQWPNATSRDSTLSVLASDKVTVLETDFDDGSGNGCDSTLETGDASAIAGLRLRQPGGYFPRVQAASPNDVINPYRMLVTLTPDTLTPESEPNDMPTQANPIVTPQKTTGVIGASLEKPSSVDYFSVTVDAPTLLHISADGDPARIGITADLIVELLDADGTTVLFEANSSGANSVGIAEAFCYRITKRGTYFVRVRPDRRTYGRYDLMVAACHIDVPKLAIRRVGTGVVLAWPASALGFQLQSADDMKDWSDVATPPVLAGDEIQVHLPVVPREWLFRLRAQ